MIRAARSWRAENWADFLPSVLGISRPSVDLFAVARHRHIRHLGFRFIIPRGVLLPVKGGFEVYLRDPIPKDVDISDAEPAGLLSPRQRFSLAHEIAHTFFYKFSDSVPAADGSISNGFELEQICNRTAGHILVPTDLLKREIDERKKADAAFQINAGFVRSIALKFRTSLTVAVERLSVVASSNPFERCIVLARRTNGDADIRAVYCGVGFLLTLPRPQKYTRVTEWLADFPARAIAEREDLEWKITRGERPITFTKTESRSGEQFLLEVQVAAKRVP